MQASQASAVRLEAVPPRLFLESQDHQHDVIRELALIDLGNRFELTDAQVPRRLAALLGDIHHEYADVRAATRRQALSAAERGEEQVNLVVPVRPGITEALRRWLRLVEEFDRVSAQGSMLTLAARPEVRAFRRWYVEAITGAVAASTEAQPVVRYGASRAPGGPGGG